MTQSQSQDFPPTHEPSFAQGLRGLRADIKLVAERVKAQHAEDAIDLFGPQITAQQADQIREVHANIDLAFRHLEDAAMRLGKAIQAYDGGSSVYDKAEA